MLGVLAQRFIVGVLAQRFMLDVLAQRRACASVGS
jgi:hypothetical protein